MILTPLSISFVPKGGAIFLHIDLMKDSSLMCLMLIINT